MSTPALAIIHYHLRHGGVTRVIRALSNAYTKAGVDHVILCGDRSDAPGDLPVDVMPALDYSESGENIELAEELSSRVRGRFPDREIVWHFHNPSLGKNPSLTAAVAELARRGEAMLLHHHDFAEDGRPELFARLASIPDLYPTGPRILHGFANSNDLHRLIAAGLPESCGSVITNPLPDLRRCPPPPDGPPLVFQPVRGIRRKNLGETLLLAALAPAGTRFAISRAPEQPRWQPIHDEWRRLADELELPVRFDVSDRIAPADGAMPGFESWLDHSTHLLSTSVAEGFGLPFLEAPALGRTIFGRELPHLGRDLPPIRSSRLYRALPVPPDFLSTAPECDTDFGHLHESLQKEVIHLTARGKRGITARGAAGSEPLEDWLERNLGDRRAEEVDLSRHRPEAVAAELLQHARRISAARGEVSHLDRDRVAARFQGQEMPSPLCG